MNYFGQNLKHLRQQRGLNQGELASEFNLSNSQISNYEKGASFPTMELAFKFCEYFNYGLDDLFRRDIRPPTEPPDGKKAQLTEGAKEKDVGASTATESPPPKEDVKAMKRQMLEMMLKLEEMDAAS